MPRATFIKLLALGLFAIGVLYAYGGWEVRTVGEEARFMQPTLKKRALKLLAHGRAPARGDYVWFRHPRYGGNLLCARAVGLPGDRVSIEAGSLVVNGIKVAEGYVAGRSPREHLVPVRVPAGCLFVLNDARDARKSPRYDSRQLGPIALSSVSASASGGRGAVVLREVAAP